MEKLDTMIAKKDVAFAKNREILQSKVNSGAPAIQKLVNTAKEKFAAASHAMDNLFKMKLSMKVELKDIPNFGDALSKESEKFRWVPA